MRRGLGAALAALALGLLPAAPAGAQGAAFSIVPVNGTPYFIFNSAPGGSVRGAVRVVNVSGRAGRVNLYPVNATTGQTSGAVYLQHKAMAGVGAWVHLSDPSLTLGPHQSRVVAFSGQVPSGAAGGQHLAGLVAAPLRARATQVAHRGKRIFHVNIREIAIVAVQVNLPGQRQRMSIAGVSASGRPGYQTYFSE